MVSRDWCHHRFCKPDFELFHHLFCSSTPMFTKFPRTRPTRAVASLSQPKCRSYVQPSVADRASVVDVPSTYKDDNLFTPRPGAYSSKLCLSYTFNLCIDMLGFKLGTRKDGSVENKTRPIYLDLQACVFFPPRLLSNL